MRRIARRSTAVYNSRMARSPRLHHSGFGAVRADADPRAARRNAGAGLSGARAIRSRWRGATLYLPTRRACRLARDLLPRRDRAKAPPSCRASSPSATSTRTRSPSRRRRPARSRPTRSICRRRSAGSNGACCWRNWCANGRAAIAPDKKGEAALVANNPAAALALADDLARLMDDMTTRAGAVGAARRARAGRISTATGSSRSHS